jgi:outer membrane protein OmpA-like peptidoglycan-associated protein
MPVTTWQPVLLAVGLALSGPARAQPHAGVNAQLAEPAVDAYGLATVEGARSLARSGVSFKATFSYAYQPLKVAVPGIGTAAGLDPVIDHLAEIRLGLALAVIDRLTVAIDVGGLHLDPGVGYGQRGVYRAGASRPSTGLIALRPLSNIDPSGGYEPHGRSVPTDARLAVKYRLASALAVVAALGVPFGDEEMFVGDRSFVIAPTLAAETRWRRLRLLGNLGARVRRRTVLESFDPATESAQQAQAVLDVGSEIAAAAGLVLPLASTWRVAAETKAFVPLPPRLSWGSCRLHSGARCSSLRPDQYVTGRTAGDFAALGLASIEYAPTSSLLLRMTAGTAAVPGGGRGEDVRAELGLSWLPAQRRRHGDSDHDGIPDAIDGCPDQAEDRDDFQDDDGCPEDDNDGDGIADQQDSCPNDPEDRDGHDDDDGCPDLDNDGDGIRDVMDQCPSEPEDLDGFADDDGCPDPDNDLDSVPDGADKCPDERENINGIDDDDGCLDATVRGGPVLEADRINLQGAEILFLGPSGARLRPSDRATLAAVAKILTAYPHVRIRVVVHVPLGTRSRRSVARRRQAVRDRWLSSKRARVLIDELIGLGVAPEQLEARPLGSSAPAVRPAQAPSNQRVELLRAEDRR